jgi:hypothetical protein
LPRSSGRSDQLGFVPEKATGASFFLYLQTVWCVALLLFFFCSIFCMCSFSILFCLIIYLLVPVFQSFSAFVVFFFSLSNFYLENFGVVLVLGFLVVVFLLFCTGFVLGFLFSFRASPV